MKKGILYLVPTPIGINSIVTSRIKDLVCITRHFVVETEKDARRFLKICGYDLKNNYPEFYLLNEHSAEINLDAYLSVLNKGMDMILLSDAGLPCVADPGFQMVKICQQKYITVVPLVGSSSIMMALMASGLNGQNFTFHGYIPIDKNLRISKIKSMEHDALKNNITNIFIETPYRNNQLLIDLVNSLQPSTLICVAIDLEGEHEVIRTLSATAWKKSAEILPKQPAVFIIGR